jgi:hypothetical protein
MGKYQFRFLIGLPNIVIKVFGDFLHFVKEISAKIIYLKLSHDHCSLHASFFCNFLYLFPHLRCIISAIEIDVKWIINVLIIYLFVHVNNNMNIVYVQVWMCICVCVCVCIYICIYIYIYIYVSIQTKYRSIVWYKFTCSTKPAALNNYVCACCISHLHFCTCYMPRCSAAETLNIFIVIIWSTPYSLPFSITFSTLHFSHRGYLGTFLSPGHCK